MPLDFIPGPDSDCLKQSAAKSKNTSKCFSSIWDVSTDPFLQIEDKEYFPKDYNEIIQKHYDF